MPDANFSFRWFAAAARYRLAWLGLPLALHAWTLAGPFVFDDLHLLRAAEDYSAGRRDGLSLFRFAPDQAAWNALRGDGDHPWYAPDDKRIDFFRPVPEWLFYLDVRLFGRGAAGHRAMSMAWFALALICAHRLFLAAAGGDDVLAGMAAFLLGISQTIAQPVTFVSNRSDLIVIVGICLAATACLSPKVPAPQRVLTAAFGCVLGLLSKEPAVALGAALAADWLISRRRPPHEPVDRAYRVILAVCVSLTAAYVAWYASTRWAAVASAGGGSRAERILSGLGLYAGVWSLGFPPGVLMHAPRERVIVAAILGGAVMLLAVPSLMRTCRQQRGAPFMALWTLAFAMPALLVTPESRALSVAGVGWSFLLAAMIRPRETGVWPAPLWLRHLLFTANGVLAAGCGVGTAWYMQRAEEQCRALLHCCAATQSVPIQNGGRLVVAEASSPFDLVAAGARLEVLLGLTDAGVIFLTLPGAEASITPIDARRLHIASTRTGLLNTPAHRLALGPAWPPRPGQCFTLRGCTIRVESLNENGDAAELVVEFDRPLTSPDLHFDPPLRNTESTR